MSEKDEPPVIPDDMIIKFNTGKGVTVVYDKKNLLPENDDWLETPCIPFDFENPPINPGRLATTLFETQFREGGIGLTCNQIGLPYAVFTVGWDNSNKQVFFNPKIIERSEATHTEIEGCLSYPGLFLKVKRPNRIKIQFQHVDGTHKEEIFEGMTSRVICHEMDHIEGKLFTDQVSSVTLSIAKEKRMKNLRKKKRAKNANKTV